MLSLIEGLKRAGWVEAEEVALKDVLANRRTWTYTTDRGSLTIIQIWDLINNVGVSVRYTADDEEHELFRSEWISPARCVALFDCMGILRANDAWNAWWRASLWS